MSPHKNFRKDMSIDEILSAMDKSDGNTEIIHAGQCFLQYKLHQESLEEQRKAQKVMLEEQRVFQSESLSKTNWLVWGTWALVVVTFFLCLITIFSLKN